MEPDVAAPKRVKLRVCPVVNRANFIPRRLRRFVHHLLRGAHIARFYGGKVLRIAFLELYAVQFRAVQGFQAWLEKGLVPPQCVRNATEKYFADSDQLADFLEERTTSKPEKKVPLRMLFESYFDWATNSCIKPLGMHQFGELMHSKGFSQVRDRTARYWSGLALRAG